MFSKLKVSVSTLAPGVSVAVTLGLAASFLGEHYGAPTMLFALLLGMALRFLHEDERAAPGINFAGRGILRLGVGLLGLRIAMDDVMAVGLDTLALIAGAIVTTILVGVALARLFGMRGSFGALTGGAVAICGASAAMAISAIMPKSDTKERDTIFAVVGVTSLSTIAMILYPIISNALAHADVQAGLFLGATIHDVAQVVGAGYSISPEAGDMATLIKLIRVAFLVPVVFILAMIFARGSGEKSGVIGLPWFLLLFAGLVVLNSVIALPEMIAQPVNDASRFMLVTAIAAIGLKSNLKELATVGIKPVLLMVAETAWIAIIALICLAML